MKFAHPVVVSAELCSTPFKCIISGTAQLVGGCPRIEGMLELDQFIGWCKT